MKHLKTYKIFENTQDLRLDVNDILLELKDIGYESNVMNFSMDSTSWFCVKISNDRFNWIDIEEYVERSKSYLESKGFIFESIHLIYISNNYKSYSINHILNSRSEKNRDFKSYDEFLNFINNTDFINKNKIHQLSMSFEK